MYVHATVRYFVRSEFFSFSFIVQFISWAAVSAGLSLVVLLAIEKPFMCISGHFEQIKIDWLIDKYGNRRVGKSENTFRRAS